MNNYPPLPIHIGKKNEIKDQDGRKLTYVIKDEIVEMENKGKAIYLQQLKFADGHEEFRFAHWMFGKKGLAKDKWVYGQFAPMVTKEVFERILKKAVTKGWFAS